MSKRLFLDFHALQTLPPSNINRDDTGSPKTAQYGGVRRARVSSQSWKKAMRDYFNLEGDTSNVGVRTLEIVQYLAKKIVQLDANMTLEKALDLADETINAAGVKTKDQKAKALFFLGDKQACVLAEAAISGEKDKKKLQAILKDNPAIDIALFGRMVADDPSLNEDASSQVAHAISTHAVQTEFDFYTAVDDLAPEDNAGAGMLGTIEFNSSTIYRYANIAVHELASQLGDKEATAEAARLFVEAFVKSIPTGKVNTFANQTLPEMILVTVREDRPVNLVTAFEEPVKSSDGFMKRSIDKLLSELTNLNKFSSAPILSLLVSTKDLPESLDTVHEKENLSDLLEELSSTLKTTI